MLLRGERDRETERKRETEKGEMGSAPNHGQSYDLSFKILLIGDSGVGKSSLLLSFISSSVEDLAPTIGTPLSLFLFIFNS